MVSIRLMEEKDLQAVSEMYVENWKATYPGLVNQEYLDNMNVPWAMDKWTKFLATEGNGIFIADKEGQVMGFGAFRPSDHLEDSMFLDALHVSKDARDLGIGSKLIRAIGQKAIEEGFSRMNISIVSGNEHARRLYVNRGVVHYEFEKIDFAGVPSNVEYFMWPTLDSFK